MLKSIAKFMSKLWLLWRTHRRFHKTTDVFGVAHIDFFRTNGCVRHRTHPLIYENVAVCVTKAIVSTQTLQCFLAWKIIKKKVFFFNDDFDVRYCEFRDEITENTWKKRKQRTKNNDSIEKTWSKVHKTCKSAFCKLVSWTTFDHQFLISKMSFSLQFCTS